MTYSLAHAADEHLKALLDSLDQDMTELRKMVDVYGDVMDLRGRRPTADPDHTGRQATHGPSRPTEDTALDPARSVLTAAVGHGVTRVARAIALVRGTTAEMDRALGTWEGDTPTRARGVHGRTGGATGDE